MLILLVVTACGEKKNAPETQGIENFQDGSAEETSSERADTEMKMYINDTEIPVMWESNPSVSALRNDLEAGDIVVSMSMYSNNEQVGPLGKPIPAMMFRQQQTTETSFCIAPTRLLYSTALIRGRIRVLAKWIYRKTR